MAFLRVCYSCDFKGEARFLFGRGPPKDLSNPGAKVPDDVDDVCWAFFGRSLPTQHLSNLATRKGVEISDMVYAVEFF